MGKPAARMGDLTAHGGTIVLGLPTVLIGKMPASTLGDMHVCPMCTGPVPHVGGPIILGSMGVLIGKKPAARVSDQAVCVGPPSMNAMGCFTVLIGEAGSGSQAGAAEAAATAAAAGKTGPKAIKPFPLSEPPAAPPKVHSVDFEFLDSAGKPLNGIPFSLKDPDGKLIVGASSMDGKGSYGGYVKEGSFTVTIPVLSEAKWDKAEIAASESCGWSVKADGFDEGAQAWVSVYGTGEGGLRLMVVTEEKKVQGGKVTGTWDAKASLLSEAGHKPELETCESFQIMVCVGQCVAVSSALKVHDTVEIVLTGDAGKPRKDMPYTLTLRDGTVLKGKLDGQGKAKHEKVVRGRFQVVFGDTKAGVGEQKPAAPREQRPTSVKEQRASAEMEMNPDARDTAVKQEAMKSSGTSLKKGDKGPVIEELNLRLAGFGGGVPKDTFDEETEVSVKRFQSEWMKIKSSTGVFDLESADALDKFASEHRIDISAFKCKCGECSGFGKGQYKGMFQGSSKKESAHKFEYPGIHRSLYWAFIALQHHLKSLKLSIHQVSSAYRCWVDNKNHGRKSTNHMGKALDVTVADAAGNKCGKTECDSVRALMTAKMKCQIRWGSSNKFSLEPSEKRTPNEYTATNWVHFDVREFQSKFLEDRFFCKSNEALNGKSMHTLMLG